MKIKKLIQGVSKIYREKLSEISELNKELNEIKIKLKQIAMTKGEGVTLEKYNYLLKREREISVSLAQKKQFCDGIGYAREYLMNFDFNTEVDLND